MSRCANPAVHERACGHIRPAGGPGWRIDFADGCRVHVCEGCWWDRAKAPDVIAAAVAVSMVDRDGIPISEKAWTEADRLGHMMRST